ncbi:MAG: SGNH/GDSL hydrolase family protein [Clostridia bacterium]|nr:SGNH/GDSL hydrolase family protein [Clostridia bacterium]
MNVKKLLSVLLSVFVLSGMILLPASAPAEDADRYQAMLDSAEIYAGSNTRLQKILNRAKNGENITLAVIGGSITEGAGAGTYKDCWASRLLRLLRAEYGTDDGLNIGLVNAGVGGTPSTFGWIRYYRDIVDKVKDDDGLPDIVIIEYAVNDGGEPTNRGCYESMVREILAAENEPAVILLFSVFRTGYTLQDQFIPIGRAYDLTMVSMRDSVFPLIGDMWTQKEFFYDEYHPTALGHGIMADCIMNAIRTDAQREPDDREINVKAVMPVSRAAYTGMRRIFGDSIPDDIAFSCGGFSQDDPSSYSNIPVGRVCGRNFAHTALSGNEPLTFTASFRNMLISYRTVSDRDFGKAEVYINGEKVMTLNGKQSGAWGQSDTKLILPYHEADEYHVEIRMAEGSENKPFTITAIAFTP